MIWMMNCYGIGDGNTAMACECLVGQTLGWDHGTDEMNKKASDGLFDETQSLDMTVTAGYR